jgi:hypothetical protein
VGAAVGSMVDCSVPVAVKVGEMVGVSVKVLPGGTLVQVGVALGVSL